MDRFELHEHKRPSTEQRMRNSNLASNLLFTHA